MPERICPFTNCNKAISSQHFACGMHWFRVPEIHKKAVLLAYGKYKRAEGAQEGIAAGNALRAAQAAAIKAVESR